MNKVELIAQIAEKSGLSKKDAEKALAATVDAITEAVSTGDKVQLATPRPRKPLRSPRPAFPFSRPAVL